MCAGLDLKVMKAYWQRPFDFQRSSAETLKKTDHIMNRLLPGIAAMAIIVVSSNILVQFLLLDGLLTWGAFTYPLAFLVTDLMNRVYGAADARRVVLVGFIAGIICSFAGSQITLQGDGYEYNAVAFRVAIGSGVAFLVAQLTDIYVFDQLREGTWWRAPLVSSMIGSIIDTALFFTIAFSESVHLFSEAVDNEISWAWELAPLLTTGADAPLWMSLAIADWIVKVLVAIIALIPFRFIISKIFAVGT